jgi:hypothetical protein
VRALTAVVVAVRSLMQAAKAAAKRTFVPAAEQEVVAPLRRLIPVQLALEQRPMPGRRPLVAHPRAPVGRPPQT